MPSPEPEQEVLPDFSTHPDFQPLFDALVAGGQNREQATTLLADLWHRRAQVIAPQAAPPPPLPQDPQQQPQQHLGAPQHQPLDQAQPQPPNHGPLLPQPQHPQPPLCHHHAQPAAQPHQFAQDQDPRPPPAGDAPVPQDPPLLPDHHQEIDQEDKRGPNHPPIDLNAESHTMSLLSPPAYAIDKLRKGEYVPLWYFTSLGRRTADKDKVSNEDLWDVTKTSDNRLSFRTAATNRPSPSALSDEQLTWEQFMDGNHLFCRWLQPAGWTPGYVKVLSSFFYQIENHETIDIDGGKE